MLNDATPLFLAARYEYTYIMVRFDLMSQLNSYRIERFQTRALIFPFLTFVNAFFLFCLIYIKNVRFNLINSSSSNNKKIEMHINLAIMINADARV